MSIKHDSLHIKSIIVILWVRIVKFAVRKYDSAMEAIYKSYEAPTTNVVDVKSGGIICQSPGGNQTTISVTYEEEDI